MIIGECPIGTEFDRNLLQIPWMPYNSTQPPQTFIFNSMTNQDCADNEISIRNTIAMNTILVHYLHFRFIRMLFEAKLNHGDTLIIPSGSHCMSAGVYATRLAHTTIDLRGELIFPQSPRTWPNKTNGGYVHAILITGSTNLTITSNSKSGLIRAKGCLEWYLK